MIRKREPAGDQVACLGDLMLEWLIHTPDPPQAGRTQIVDMQALKFGGPAYNVSWYFSKFGLNPRLIGLAGRQQEQIVTEAMLNAGLDRQSILWHTGQCDLLFAALTPNEHYSFYARTTISHHQAQTLTSKCDGADVVVLSGSRHAPLRSEMVTLSQSFKGRFLAFNPSYAISEFSPSEFKSIFQRATLVILNQRESRIACNYLGIPNEAEFVETTDATVIITKGARGAEIWSKDSHIHVNTFATEVISTVGAGDALFAGYLYGKLRGETTSRSGQFGMTLAAYVVESAETRVEVRLPEVESRMHNDFKLGINV